MQSLETHPLPSAVEREDLTSRSHPARLVPLVDIVLPVHNEEHVLAASTERLRSHLDRTFPFSAVVTIVDNGSTDSTFAVAERLESELGGVRAVRLEDKGRGRALRFAWSRSEAPVVAYMDVDLSSSLNAFLPLVASVVSGHAAVAIGTRLAHGANVVRCTKREVISRLYNLLLKVLLRSGFSDAQCGFKVLDARAARRLMEEVEDNDWFFDTELLVRAQRHGMRIDEVPVDWVEDPDSRVRILRTAMDDLKGVLRLLLDRFSTRSRAPWPVEEFLGNPSGPPAPTDDRYERYALHTRSVSEVAS